MKGPRVEYDLTGLEKMVEALDKMGVDVEPAVTKAAQAGMKIVKRGVKATAPVGKKRGGRLKRAVGHKKEKTKFPGKRVYEVRISPNLKNRDIKKPGIYGGKSKTGYYPASQEYGFLVPKKDGSGVEYRYSRIHEDFSFVDRKGRLIERHDTADWYRDHGSDSSRSLKLKRIDRHGKRHYLETVQGVESRKVEGQHFMKKGAEQSEDQAKRTMIDTMKKELDNLWQEMQHE